jgi:prolyl-tRNA synthetase
VRFSQTLIPTLREAPADAEVVSHKLLVRGGFIMQVARGIYDYLPMGLRVIRKVETIVRQELDAVGCAEVLMPVIVPAELWQESGRWQKYGKELLRLKDRNNREFCVGPTHEEVITDIVRKYVRSYRDLPKHLYQIHTKFRDEIRPRFGLMRGREFIMEDGYSFHANTDDLDKHYVVIRDAYQRIFTRCGLKSRVVEADTGAIGGKSSHEVVVLADTGEDAIAGCTRCEYAANVERAEARIPDYSAAADAAVQKVHTPALKSAEEVAKFLKLPHYQMIKTMVYLRDGGVVVALVRGDSEVNEIKLKNAVAADFVTFADASTVRAVTGADVGFAGPVGLPKSVEGIGAVTVVADPALKGMIGGGTGANETDYHLTGVAEGRDFRVDHYADIRIVKEGDHCPRCDTGELKIVRGIEVGHIFKLGTRYSEPMKATVLDADSKEHVITMGTYGLGIGRTMAAAVEQNHDEKGMVWPLPIAPAHVHLILAGMDEEKIRMADEAYAQLQEQGIEVLYDDRDLRPGVKFNDAELIGIPFQLVIGKKTASLAQLEWTVRATGAKRELSLTACVEEVKSQLTK